MRFAWRIPHNTIYVIVREVCRAIIDEYVDEVMPLPTTAADWKTHFRWLLEKMGTFLTLWVRWMASIFACKCPTSSGPHISTIRSTTPFVLLALVDYDYKFIWAVPWPYPSQHW
ncbi:uncharacterized protein LOC132721144 [Ruditapes philippinarum]|uniref:uncharacterized protein LOC132721144 n=1 Tax=Ruditapes philippinarum TaxID=129788 RepID=UPI00295ACD53|nr:uncharacterized protein LOC132721144 [Ruditapes philippinarum]